LRESNRARIGDYTDLLLLATGGIRRFSLDGEAGCKQRYRRPIYPPLLVFSAGVK